MVLWVLRERKDQWVIQVFPGVLGILAHKAQQVLKGRVELQVFPDRKDAGAREELTDLQVNRVLRA